MIQTAAEHLRSVDPVLGRLVEKIGPLSVKARRMAVFQSLAQAIIYQRKRKMPEPEQLERYGEKWRPYRTVAAMYLWRAVDAL